MQLLHKTQFCSTILNKRLLFVLSAIFIAPPLPTSPGMHNPFLAATYTNQSTRSSDGLTLMISSSDGFCSTLTFAAGELGEVYKGEIGPPKSQTAASSNQSTPMPTPTNAFAPPSPFPNGSHHQHRNSASSFTAPSPPQSASLISQRPSSPTRSNSTSSIATITTQASTVPATGVVTNPTLISGNVPSISATNTGKVTGVPLTTPPETPRSATGSVAGTKRDASEGEKEETKEPKKRRIAPTLVEPKS
jgi:chromatin assembly factor 1 subunit B